MSNRRKIIIKNKKRDKILFYVNNYEAPEKADYQHVIISLAEGLKDLDIVFDSNINYYKLSNEEYLFKKKENIEPNDYDFIITGYTCGSKVSHLLNKKDTSIPKHILTNSNKKYKTIMLDWSDGLMEHFENKSLYDYYFTTNYNKNIMNMFNNVFPLAFYSTNRIIKATSKHIEYSKKKDKVFYPHRIDHYFRELNKKLYIEEDFIRIFNDNFRQPLENTEEYLWWSQTGRRHNTQFYSELSNSKIVDCSGGYFTGKIAYQIDSFKLWEGFFSKCCVICLDFDYFNIKLPVQPINMVHYIGLTNNINENRKIIKSLKSRDLDPEKIAKEGYKWVVENYSPKSLANYFLKIIK